MSFAFQWHLTSKCGYNCKHCYGKVSEKNELTLEQILSIIEELSNFVNKYHFNSVICFTGGDPLIRKDFFQIVRKSYDEGFKIRILGTPDINERIIQKLSSFIDSYQLSLEGLEKTNDAIRGKGHFKKTLNAIKILKNYKVPVHILSTVGKYNASEIPFLAEEMSKIGVDVFDFARVIGIGNAKIHNFEPLPAQEYRSFLEVMLNTYFKLDEKYETKFGFKENLWKLLFFEYGLKPQKSDSFIDGCIMGWKCAVIIEDGSVMPCRRIPLIAGNLRNQDFEEIFFNSPLFQNVREVEKIEKCNSCELFKVCRGCRAAAYVKYGDIFSKDPQCWK